METKQQTKVTKQNKSGFFLAMYHHQNSTKDQLVNLDSLKETQVILVDCCGWYYKKLFTQKSIVGLETIKTVKQFELDKTYFDRLIDNQQDQFIGWPSVCVDDCAVVFDRSPLLKYRSLDQLSEIITDVTDKYMPNTVILEQSLTFIDDNRLVDRFYNFAKFKINGYIVKKITYDADQMHISIRLQKKFNQS
jgi:hypothetical protein